ERVHVEGACSVAFGELRIEQQLDADVRDRTRAATPDAPSIELAARRAIERAESRELVERLVGHVMEANAAAERPRLGLGGTEAQHAAKIRQHGPEREHRIGVETARDRGVPEKVHLRTRVACEGSTGSLSNTERIARVVARRALSPRVNELTLE